MDSLNLFTTQLSDVLRIGMLAALIYVAERNRANTGFAMPVALGMVFVAVVNASAKPVAGVPFWYNAASGLLANAVIMAVLLAAWTAYKATRK